MYYSVVEVSKKLNCSIETIRRKIRSGKLNAIKVNDQYMIKDDDIQKMLRNSIVANDISEEEFEKIFKIFYKM